MHPGPPLTRNLSSPDFVRFERQYTLFLHFGVRLPSVPCPIALDLMGPDRIQEFIRATFIDNVTLGSSSP